MRQGNRWQSFIAALAIFLGAATSGRAQDSQCWDIQYGPVGQLLGGQVVGSARDLSATYYNPGGLALAERSEFLLSVQAFSMRTFSTTPRAAGRSWKPRPRTSALSRASSPSRFRGAGSAIGRSSPSPS